MIKQTGRKIPSVPAMAISSGAVTHIAMSVVIRRGRMGFANVIPSRAGADASGIADVEALCLAAQKSHAG